MLILGQLIGHKKCQKNSGKGKPPPQIRAMPELKRVFCFDVFPYLTIFGWLAFPSCLRREISRRTDIGTPSSVNANFTCKSPITIYSNYFQNYEMTWNTTEIHIFMIIFVKLLKKKLWFYLFDGYNCITEGVPCFVDRPIGS